MIIQIKSTHVSFWTPSGHSSAVRPFPGGCRSHRRHAGSHAEQPARFLRQNGKRLSNRSREREVAALTSEEVRRIEELYVEAFLTRRDNAPVIAPGWLL